MRRKLVKMVPFNFFFHGFVNFAKLIFPGEPLFGQSLFVLIAETKLVILDDSYYNMTHKIDAYLLDLTMSMTRLPTPAWAAPASNTALKSFILYPTLKKYKFEFLDDS